MLPPSQGHPQLLGLRPKVTAQEGCRGAGIRVTEWGLRPKGRATHLRGQLHCQLNGWAGTSDPRPAGQWQVSRWQERSGLDRQALGSCHHCGGQGAGELRQELRGSRRQHFWQRWGENGSRRGHCGDLGGDIHGIWRRVAKQDLGAQRTGMQIGVRAMAFPEGPGPKQALPPSRQVSRKCRHPSPSTHTPQTNPGMFVCRFNETHKNGHSHVPICIKSNLKLHFISELLAESG